MRGLGKFLRRPNFGELRTSFSTIIFTLYKVSRTRSLVVPYAKIYYINLHEDPLHFYLADKWDLNKTLVFNNHRQLTVTYQALGHHVRI